MPSAPVFPRLWSNAHIGEEVCQPRWLKLFFVCRGSDSPRRRPEEDGVGGWRNRRDGSGPDPHDPSANKGNYFHNLNLIKFRTCWPPTWRDYHFGVDWDEAKLDVIPRDQKNWKYSPNSPIYWLKSCWPQRKNNWQYLLTRKIY